jgi:hypothetical protein
LKVRILNNSRRIYHQVQYGTVVPTHAPVMIDHVEGLLELLYLVLVEHGEHIAEEVNTSVSMSAPEF